MKLIFEGSDRSMNKLFEECILDLMAVLSCDFKRKVSKRNGSYYYCTSVKESTITGKFQMYDYDFLKYQFSMVIDPGYSINESTTQSMNPLLRVRMGNKFFEVVK